MKGDRVKVTATTLVRGKSHLIHLIECTVCGPVAVDTTGVANWQVASDHLAAAHSLTLSIPASDVVEPHE